MINSLTWDLCCSVSNMAAKVGELEDSIREVYQHSKDNRKEVGRLEGKTELFYLWTRCEICSDFSVCRVCIFSFLEGVISEMSKTRNMQELLTVITCQITTAAPDRRGQRSKQEQQKLKSRLQLIRLTLTWLHMIYCVFRFNLWRPIKSETSSW